VLRDLTRPSITSLALLAFAVILLLQLGERDSDDDGPATPTRVTAAVTRVVDGDTVEAEFDGREEDVRYIGVDTPESVKPDSPVECYGPEAADFNRRLVEGKTVELELGAEQRDRYGRLLAYVRLGDTFVNEELLRRGFATTLTIPPNDKYADRFAEIEREAGREGRGLWGAC
jgi:micrococcal nuclease